MCNWYNQEYPQKSGDAKLQELRDIEVVFCVVFCCFSIVFCCFDAFFALK